VAFFVGWGEEMDLFFDTEFRQLIAPLLPEERDGLAASLIAQGNLAPIIIWEETKLLLDGHNRYDICTEHNIPLLPPIELSFPDRNSAVTWIITNQLARRNLGLYQRSVLVLKLEALYKERARQRQQEHGGTAPGRARETLVPMLAQVLSGKTRDQVAALAHVSHGTIEKVKVIETKAAAEQKAQLIKGTATVNAIYNGIRQKERLEEQLQKIKNTPLPTGSYRVLVIDPPWAYTNRQMESTHRAAGAERYEQMTVDDLKDRKQFIVPAHEDAIMWLWTTNAFLHDALHLMEYWGFQQQTMLTWVKPHMGTGDWLRGKTEHCLLGVRGNYRITPGNATTVLEAASGSHSTKPDAFYALVERLCPGERIDMFARRKRDGWATWGAEVEG